MMSGGPPLMSNRTIATLP